MTLRQNVCARTLRRFPFKLCTHMWIRIFKIRVIPLNNKQINLMSSYNAVSVQNLSCASVPICAFFITTKYLIVNKYLDLIYIQRHILFYYLNASKFANNYCKVQRVL